MEHSDYSTDDIACKCGFRNTAAFNSAFKFTFGITPTVVLNLFYVACLAMIWMYFFDRLDTLSVLLLCTLTYFYARKNWKSYTKRNLWLICVIDMIIAALYNLGIYLEPVNEYTNYMLTEIWIRPTITYGLVACFVTESNRYNQ